MRQTLVFHVTLDMELDEELATAEIESLKRRLEWLSAGLVDHTHRIVEQLQVSLGDSYTVPDKPEPDNDDDDTDTEEDWGRYRKEEGLPKI